MNKSNFVKNLALELGESATSVNKYLNALEKTIVKGLIAEDKIQITGLLTFTAKNVAASVGRNPKTGDAIKIPAGRRITVKVGKTLRDGIKGR